MASLRCWQRKSWSTGTTLREPRGGCLNSRAVREAPTQPQLASFPGVMLFLPLPQLRLAGCDQPPHPCLPTGGSLPWLLPSVWGPFHHHSSASHLPLKPRGCWWVEPEAEIQGVVDSPRGTSSHSGQVFKLLAQCVHLSCKPAFVVAISQFLFSLNMLPPVPKLKSAPW